MALLWLATRSLDGVAFGAALGSAQPGFLALAVLLAVVANILIGLRWHGLLAACGAPVSRRLAVNATFLGELLNSVLPSTVGGDAARVVYAVRAGAPLQAAIAASILDRVAPTAVLLTAAAAVIIAQPRGLELPAVLRGWVGWGAVAIVGGMLVLAVVARALAGRGVPGWLGRQAGVLILRAAMFRVPGSALLAAVLWSGLVIVLIGLAMAFLAVALHVGGFSLADGLVVAAPVLVVASLPVSIGGWGTREVAMAAMFEFLGFAAQDGVATSVLLGLAMTLASLPGLYLWLRTQRPTARLVPLASGPIP